MNKDWGIAPTFDSIVNILLKIQGWDVLDCDNL
jgi:hypothetical protein